MGLTCACIGAEHNSSKIKSHDFSIYLDSMLGWGDCTASLSSGIVGVASGLVALD